MMKRILILAILALMLFSILCSCGEENLETGATTSKNTIVTYSYNAVTTTKPAQSATNPSDKVEDTTDSIWTENKK